GDGAERVLADGRGAGTDVVDEAMRLAEGRAGHAAVGRGRDRGADLRDGLCGLDQERREQLAHRALDVRHRAVPPVPTRSSAVGHASLRSLSTSRTTTSPNSPANAPSAIRPRAPPK